MKYKRLALILLLSLTACTRGNKETPVLVATPVPDKLKVSAFLVYEDESISSFDVLNDKSKALWNTNAGEGDAGKPSQKVRIVLEGSGQHYQVTIRNGATTDVDVKDVTLAGELPYVITGTGCEKIEVSVTNANQTYHGTIDFQCGE